MEGGQNTSIVKCLEEVKPSGFEELKLSVEEGPEDVMNGWGKIFRSVVQMWDWIPIIFPVVSSGWVSASQVWAKEAGSWEGANPGKVGTFLK